MVAPCIRGYYGLGDTVYQRPFVAALAEEHGEVWLTTSWPQLYHDVPNVRLVRPSEVEPLNLRTQRMNVERVDSSVWSAAPKWAKWERPGYSFASYRESKTSIVSDFQKSMRVKFRPELFALSQHESWPSFGPLPVVRPSTVRREWPAPGRNPPDGCIPLCVDRYGNDWVSVAWCSDDEEWLSEPAFHVRHRFERGELTTEELLGVFAGARLVLTGVGFAVPLCLALGTPVFVIYGGAHPPGWIVDDRIRTETYAQVVPEPFCACGDHRHDCKKPLTPEHAAERFTKWASALP